MPNAGRDEGANTGRDDGVNTGCDVCQNTERDDGANTGCKTQEPQQSGRRRTAAFINHTVAAD